VPLSKTPAPAPVISNGIATPSATTAESPAGRNAPRRPSARCGDAAPTEASLPGFEAG
jgi:hypothetical protein